MRNRPQTRESEPVLAPLSGDIRLCRLYGANSAGGRGEIDDETSVESVPSSISSDFPKAGHIREAFANIREGLRGKNAG